MCEETKRRFHFSAPVRPRRKRRPFGVRLRALPSAQGDARLGVALRPATRHGRSKRGVPRSELASFGGSEQAPPYGRNPTHTVGGDLPDAPPFQTAKRTKTPSMKKGHLYKSLPQWGKGDRAAVDEVSLAGRSLPLRNCKTAAKPPTPHPSRLRRATFSRWRRLL